MVHKRYIIIPGVITSLHILFFYKLQFPIVKFFLKEKENIYVIYHICVIYIILFIFIHTFMSIICDFRQI